MRVDVSFAFFIFSVVAIWIVGVVGSAMSRLLADEFKSWLPCLTKWLIRLAVARLPEEQRERYKEEWQSHVDELPGDIGKVVAASGFLRAAHKISLLNPLAGKLWYSAGKYGGSCRYTVKKGFMHSEVHKMRATKIGGLEVQFVERRGWKTTTKMFVTEVRDGKRVFVQRF